jgi:hypothetical protein
MGALIKEGMKVQAVGQRGAGSFCPDHSTLPPSSHRHLSLPRPLPHLFAFSLSLSLFLRPLPTILYPLPTTPIGRTASDCRSDRCLLARWAAGLLACWSAGLLVCWSAGLQRRYERNSLQHARGVKKTVGFYHKQVRDAAMYCVSDMIAPSLFTIDFKTVCDGYRTYGVHDSLESNTLCGICIFKQP